MIILIDNYDSFTWNLWHFLSDLGEEVKTLRNNTFTAAEIIEMKPTGIVISPGPGRPEQAGGFLTRDPRVVERKKYGKAKARRSFQFSKR